MQQSACPMTATRVDGIHSNRVQCRHRSSWRQLPWFCSRRWLLLRRRRRLLLPLLLLLLLPLLPLLPFLLCQLCSHSGQASPQTGQQLQLRVVPPALQVLDHAGGQELPLPQPAQAQLVGVLCIHRQQRKGPGLVTGYRGRWDTARQETRGGDGKSRLGGGGANPSEPHLQHTQPPARG